MPRCGAGMAETVSRRLTALWEKWEKAVGDGAGREGYRAPPHLLAGEDRNLDHGGVYLRALPLLHPLEERVIPRRRGDPIDHFRRLFSERLAVQFTERVIRGGVACIDVLPPDRAAANDLLMGVRGRLSAHGHSSQRIATPSLCRRCFAARLCAGTANAAAAAAGGGGGNGRGTLAASRRLWRACTAAHFLPCARKHNLHTGRDHT